MYKHIRKVCKLVNCPNKDSLLLNVVQKQVEIQNQQIKQLTNTVETLTNTVKIEPNPIESYPVIKIKEFEYIYFFFGQLFLKVIIYGNL